MGVTKSELFTAKQNELANIAKALAHPARIAIIQHLLRVNAWIGGEIVEVLPLSQPTISQHLKELKKVGLRLNKISPDQCSIYRPFIRNCWNTSFR
jgi:ArsR family transcriptional regulator